jgi:hypothetical protein
MDGKCRDKAIPCLYDIFTMAEFYIPPFFLSNFCKLHINCIYINMKLFPAILLLLISTVIYAQVPLQL